MGRLLNLSVRLGQQRHQGQSEAKAADTNFDRFQRRIHNVPGLDEATMAPVTHMDEHGPEDGDGGMTWSACCLTARHRGRSEEENVARIEDTVMAEHRLHVCSGRST